MKRVLQREGPLTPEQRDLLRKQIDAAVRERAKKLPGTGGKDAAPGGYTTSRTNGKS